MDKNHPNPDISAPGVQSHVASATDFTGIAQNLAHNHEELAEIAENITMDQDPYIQYHNTQRMKAEKKSEQH